MATDNTQLDLSTAQLEPFRALHFFHEHLNIQIKCMTAGTILLANAAATSSAKRELGNLIEASHPAWNKAPVHEISVSLYKQLYGGVGAYAIVSIFSALDDFINGVEADIARSAATTGSGSETGPTDGITERVEVLCSRNYWPTNCIATLLPVLHYFRAMRNCIAHRSSRASGELSLLSANQDLQQVIAGMLERTTVAAPVFDEGEHIFVDPTLAICCSDVVRRVAHFCNFSYIKMIGQDGFFHLVAANFRDRARTITNAYRTPLNIFNDILVGRYRVQVPDPDFARRELRRLQLWDNVYDTFRKNYLDRSAT